MEPGLLFVGLIASISATHLAVKAGKYIHSCLPAHNPAQAARPAGLQMRGDWYVFFHCADLLGREPEDVANDSRQRTQTGIEQSVPAKQRPSRPRVRL